MFFFFNVFKVQSQFDHQITPPRQEDVIKVEFMGKWDPWCQNFFKVSVDELPEVNKLADFFVL